MTNGKLIAACEASAFDVLVTNDKNMGSQQRIEERRLAVVALPLNRRSSLLDRAMDIAGTVRLAKPGDWISIGLDGSREIVRISDGRAIASALPRIEPFR